MPETGRTYLAECYLPGTDAAAVAAAGERARAATAELAADGLELEYLGALHVAADEVVFHAFVASDPEVVIEASRRARLGSERVVESRAVPAARIDLMELLTQSSKAD